MTRAVLEDRVAAVCEQLDRTEQQLRLPFVRDSLRDTEADLDTKLADCRRDVRGVLEVASDSSAWTKFDQAEQKSRRLIAEVFALVQGALFSSAALDDGIAAAAGRLLEEVRRPSRVSRRVLLTFSPDPESVDHTIGLVRLRFPGTTVWDLPFAVHEFGHHAVREIPHIDSDHSQERPLLEVVRGSFGTGAGITEPHVQELVADVFATFALGATYPVACVLRRVSATKAARDSATHPAWHRRVATMLAALNRMSLRYDDPRYAETAAALVVPAWRSLTGAVKPEPADLPRLEALAGKVVDDLARHATLLRYDDKNAAVLVKKLLSDAAAPGPAPAVALPDGAGCAAIVDAAWRWRRQYPDASPSQRSRVDAHAIALCLAVPTDQRKP